MSDFSEEKVSVEKPKSKRWVLPTVITVGVVLLVFVVGATSRWSNWANNPSVNSIANGSVAYDDASQGSWVNGNGSGSSNTSYDSSKQTESYDSTTSTSTDVTNDRWLGGDSDVGGPVTTPVEASTSEDLTGASQVRDANMNLECGDFAEASTKLSTIMSSHGAVASYDATSTYVANGYDRRYRQVSMKLPSENLDAFVSDIESSGMFEIKQLNMQTIDMTAARNENERRRSELEKRRDEAKAELDACTDDGQRPNLERRLQNLEERLASFDEAISDIDMDANWSSVSLSLVESNDVNLSAKREFEKAVGDIPGTFTAGLYRIGLFIIQNFVGIVIVVGCVVALLVYRRKAGHWPFMTDMKNDDSSEE